MQPIDIEKTLKKIIEIDEATLAVEKEIQTLRVEKDKEIKKAMRELDLAMMKKARRLGKVERELIMKETQEEVNTIQEEGHRICEQMQRVSDHHVDALVDAVFLELIDRPLKVRIK